MGVYTAFEVVGVIREEVLAVAREVVEAAFRSHTHKHAYTYTVGNRVLYCIAMKSICAGSTPTSPTRMSNVDVEWALVSVLHKNV